MSLDISISKSSLSGFYIATTNHPQGYRLAFPHWQVFCDFFRQLVGAETSQKKLMRIYDEIHSQENTPEEKFYALKELSHTVCAKYQENFHSVIDDNGTILFYYKDLLLAELPILPIMTENEINVSQPIFYDIEESKTVSEFSRYALDAFLPALERLDELSKRADKENTDESETRLEQAIWHFKFNDFYSFICHVQSLPLPKTVRESCESDINDMIQADRGDPNMQWTKDHAYTLASTENLFDYTQRVKETFLKISSAIYSDMISQLVEDVERFKTAQSTYDVPSLHRSAASLGDRLKHFDFLRTPAGAIDFSVFEQLFACAGRPPEGMQFFRSTLEEAEHLYGQYWAHSQKDAIDMGGAPRQIPLHLQNGLNNIANLLDEYQQIKAEGKNIEVCIKQISSRPSREVGCALTMYVEGAVFVRFSLPLSRSLHYLLNEYVLHPCEGSLFYSNENEDGEALFYSESKYSMRDINRDDFNDTAKRFFDVGNDSGYFIEQGVS